MQPLLPMGREEEEGHTFMTSFSILCWRWWWEGLWWSKKREGLWWLESHRSDGEGRRGRSCLHVIMLHIIIRIPLKVGLPSWWWSKKHNGQGGGGDQCRKHVTVDELKYMDRRGRGG